MLTHGFIGQRNEAPSSVFFFYLLANERGILRRGKQLEVTLWIGTPPPDSLHPSESPKKAGLWLASPEAVAPPWVPPSEVTAAW